MEEIFYNPDSVTNNEASYSSTDTINTDVFEIHVQEDELTNRSNDSNPTNIGTEANTNKRNFKDFLEDQEFNYEYVLQASGSTGDMIHENIDLLEQTPIHIVEETLHNTPLRFILAKDTELPEEIKDQYTQLISDANILDPKELQTLTQRGGLTVILMPSDTGFERALARWRSYTIMNRLPIKQTLTMEDRRDIIGNAHEFSHMMTYLTDAGCGVTPSSAIAEGSAIFLAESYYTKKNPRSRVSMVNLDDAIFFEGYKLQDAVNELKEKGVPIPTSPTAMRSAIEMYGLRRQFNPEYAYGAALVKPLIRYCESNGLSSRENIKKFYAQSTQEVTLEQSKMLNEKKLQELGLSTDKETRSIIQSMMNTFSFPLERAAAIYLGGIREIVEKN